MYTHIRTRTGNINACTFVHTYLRVRTYAHKVHTGNTNARGAAETLLVGFVVGLEVRFTFQHNATAGFSQAHRRRFESDPTGLTREFFTFILGGLSRVNLDACLAGVDHDKILERNRVGHDHIFGLWVRITACTGGRLGYIEWPRIIAAR